MTSMEFVALAAAVLVFVGLVLLAKLHHQPLRYGIPQCPNSKLLPLSLSATLLCAKTFTRAEMQVRARPNVAFWPACYYGRAQRYPDGP
jgi:hypothetical protein